MKCQGTGDLDLCVKFICPFFLCLMITASCNQRQDGTINLVGGNSRDEGRIEVCEGGCWGHVYTGESGWRSLDAAVVCDQLQMGSWGKEC